MTALFRTLTARMQEGSITKGIFFRLLAEGENSLGGMLKRAVACGLPERYTPETAAYVFGLPLSPRKRQKKRVLLFFNSRSCFLKSLQIFHLPSKWLFGRLSVTTTSSVSGAAPITSSIDMSVFHAGIPAASVSLIVLVRRAEPAYVQVVLFYPGKSLIFIPPDCLKCFILQEKSPLSCGIIKNICKREEWMDVLRYGITARTVPSRRGMIAAISM